MSGDLLMVEGLSKRFAGRGRSVRALDDVSFSIRKGETLGIVGPSGSGKSTLARVLLRLIEPDAGRILIDGEDWRSLSPKALRHRRGDIQMVFQDPLSAFNPRTTIGKAIMDPLRIHAVGKRHSRMAALAELLQRVGLSADMASRRIHEVSGGQRQRVALARALASRPRLVVLDEALSALDVSLRGQMLELLVRLQRDEGISFLFIGHDPAVVRMISHRVAVMDQGRIVETGDADAVFSDPRSDTGKALIAAIPTWR
ncbi:ABC transporter ATP-binding protein [Pseudohoeflea suaedae]|uniref:ABC transporter ATP-binding protein n=1 Tax=Pseudohoeflea suaedae TaxID=877384 RepID=A0A4R5PN82_9HYPH|nr:ATP-binding cassette domain-containing protein [Pseudohoeflea suaedae]TDH38419.1 ABC transporter ATP-binding protein [Pseudohoeflea suaedae]